MTVHRGDLATDLLPVLAEAPPDATLVVFHSAVLPYVPEAARTAFAEAVLTSRAVWLANEAPARIPGLDAATVVGPAGVFVLCRDGVPLARADPHASWVEWFPPVTASSRG